MSSIWKIKRRNFSWMLLKFFSFFLPFSIPPTCTLILAKRRGNDIQFAVWDQRRHCYACREPWVCQWKGWDIQKISTPLCEKLILRTHPQDVLFWKLLATYLAQPIFSLCTFSAPCCSPGLPDRERFWSRPMKQKFILLCNWCFY